MTLTTPDFLTLPDRRLAYQLQRGSPGWPGVIFLSGYASDMAGTKAQFLAECCAEANLSYLRFDYRGHGRSSGDFKDGTIGAWLDDTLTVFDQLTEGPQIIIGSSMGGWIALLLALKRPERAKALIGIAAGPDFTEELLVPGMTTEQQKQLETEGFTTFHAPPPAEPLLVTKKLIEEARNHLLLRHTLSVTCPIRLLQGMQDDDVPWQHVLHIARVVPHGDVRVTLVKDGGHRLSRPQDLQTLWQMIKEFI